MYQIRRFINSSIKQNEWISKWNHIFSKKKEVTATCVTDFLETYMEANLEFHK